MALTKPSLGESPMIWIFFHLSENGSLCSGGVAQRCRHREGLSAGDWLIRNPCASDVGGEAPWAGFSGKSGYEAGVVWRWGGVVVNVDRDGGWDRNGGYQWKWYWWLNAIDTYLLCISNAWSHHYLTSKWGGLGKQKIILPVLGSVGISHRSAGLRPTTLEEDQELFVDFSSILCLRFDIQGMKTYNFFYWVSNAGPRLFEVYRKTLRFTVKPLI